MNKIITMLMLIIISLSSVLTSFILPSSLSAAELVEPIQRQNSLNKVTDKYRFVNIGKAKFSIFFWDLYKSKLLTTSGNYPIEFTKEKLLYEIHYLTNISSVDLIKRTVEQWQHLNVPKAKYKNYLADLTRIWPDINEGDRLSLLIDKGQSLFYFNGNYIGEITSPEFGQLFLDIWLSKRTSEPSLRRDLLGKNNNE